MRPTTVAVTGATGFVGRALVPALQERGHRVRALVRRPAAYSGEGVDVRRTDLLQRDTLVESLEGVDVAYYLVHSLMGGPDFAAQDRTAARNFLESAERSGIERIVYLGGLGETGPELSKHLRSRREVGEILESGDVPTTTLRAAIILGRGGASWDMLYQLVERLPLMVTPRWVEIRSQPIALRDVIAYLVGCMDVEETAGESLDIGGPDILTYREMMLTVAEIIGKRRYILGIPVLTPRLSSYWVDFVTDVPAQIARPLIDGLRNEVVVRDERIDGLIPIVKTPFREAVSLALRPAG